MKSNIKFSKCEYPDIKKVRSLLKNNKWSKSKRHVIRAYVVGSYAKGTASGESDLDIALIINKSPNKNSLKLSEYYHSKFMINSNMPHFKGVRVDFMFYFEDEEKDIINDFSYVLIEDKEKSLVL
jgi:predicted nucleotidyltransferase